MTQSEEKDIIIRFHEELNPYSLKRFVTMPVIHYLYDLLSCTVFLTCRRDKYCFLIRFCSRSYLRFQTSLMTPLILYTHQLSHRPKHCNFTLRGGLLFHQYKLYSFCKVKSARIGYLQHYHLLLRATDYISLWNLLQDPGIDKNGAFAVRSIRLYILHSTYIEKLLARVILHARNDICFR